MFRRVVTAGITTALLALAMTLVSGSAGASSFGTHQTCTGTCTVTDSGLQVTSTVTVTFDGSGTVIMDIGVDSLDCGSAFLTAPSTTTLSVTGTVVGNKAVQLVIDQSAVVKRGGNAGLAHYDVCYSSPNQFIDITGTSVNTGFLADCSTEPAPCLVSKTKDAAGDIVENFVVPQSDPTWR